MLHSAFCTVSERRSVTPHSRNRLPSISMPISGAVSGSSRMTNTATAIGNTIFSVLETTRSCSILTSRSLGVVIIRMSGGWMSGISAMYEYAAIAIAGRYSGASLEAVRIAVGPSAPPITPIAAATASGNPSASASRNAEKIPNCAAAPKRKLLGFAISGPKSVIAPTPRKISDGKILHSSRR